MKKNKKKQIVPEEYLKADKLLDKVRGKIQLSSVDLFKLENHKLRLLSEAKLEN